MRVEKNGIKNNLKRKLWQLTGAKYTATTATTTTNTIAAVAGFESNRKTFICGPLLLFFRRLRTVVIVAALFARP